MKQTIREWIESNYEREEIEAIARHGCITGCAAGLIYYKDTVKFHDDFEDEIWDLLESERENQGYKSIIGMIADFNNLDEVGSMDQFKNMLTWYAVEMKCHEIISED